MSKHLLKEKDEYRDMRYRHEWLINGKRVRPWRLYPGGPERGTLAQMIERFVMLSVPKKALAATWDGKAWSFNMVHDVAYADVMPTFIPLPGMPINPDLAVVYSTPAGQPVNGAFYGVLQAEGLQHGGELYMGMRFTTMSQNQWRKREADQHFFSYETDYDRYEIRKISLLRLDALWKDMHNEHLCDEEWQAIGWVDPFKLVEDGRQLYIEGNRQQGLPMIQQGYGEIMKMSLRHVIGHETSEPYLAARYLGEAYYDMGLYAKALYYLELAHYGLNRDGHPDPLLMDCKLRMRDFRMAKELADYSRSGEWTGRSLTRLGVVLECCLDLSPADLVSMAVLVDCDLSGAITVPGGEAILNYDLLGALGDGNLVQAYIATADRRIAVVEVRYSHAKYEMSVLLTSHLGLQLDPKCLNLSFGSTSWMSRKEFMEKRTAASQKLIDGETLMPEEQNLLGWCESAHLAMARAERALRGEALGDGLYYLHKAYYEIANCLGGQELEHWDLSLLGQICYQLGYVFSELGFAEQALAYLYKLEGSQNTFDQALLATCLCMLKDLRSVPYLRTQILDQRIKATQNHGVDYKPSYLRYLRSRLAFALVDRNRADEAKIVFGSLMCDSERYMREFAANELQKLIDGASIG